MILGTSEITGAHDLFSNSSLHCFLAFYFFSPPFAFSFSPSPPPSTPFFILCYSPPSCPSSGQYSLLLVIVYYLTVPLMTSYFKIYKADLHQIVRNDRSMGAHN